MIYEQVLMAAASGAAACGIVALHYGRMWRRSVAKAKQLVADAKRMHDAAGYERQEALEKGGHAQDLMVRANARIAEAANITAELHKTAQETKAMVSQAKEDVTKLRKRAVGMVTVELEPPGAYREPVWSCSLQISPRQIEHAARMRGGANMHDLSYEAARVAHDIANKAQKLLMDEWTKAYKLDVTG